MTKTILLLSCFLLNLPLLHAQPPCAIKNDFTFTRSVCNPLQVSLLTRSTGYTSIEWKFGDGNTATATSNPTYTYVAFGNYQVMMIQNYGSCIDTVIKQITLDVQQDNQLILTNDTTVCFGLTKQLRSQPGLSFCWTPSTGLSNPNTQNPILTATQNATYYVNSEVTGTNLIVNGNFNSGNTGFFSQYGYAAINTTEGQYFVGPNPQAWNPSLSNCRDHTTTTGNMMLVNGSPTPDVVVWRQTINVTPNTNYAFSTWIQALFPPNPAQLSFSINTKDVGTLITASLPTCTWTQFYTTWNSGSNTTATIAIINKNTIVLGNDFALDDISFAPVFIKRDSVVITVDTPVVRSSPDVTVCQGIPVQFNTTGAITYSWSPATGLSNPSIADPIATPATTTQYVVTGINANGCIEDDTVTVTVIPKPVITRTPNTTICKNATIQLNATGGQTYTWTPAATLSNPNIANPIATPLGTTMYYVTATNGNLCSSLDSVLITVDTPMVRTSNDVTICQGEPVQFTTTGASTYSWSPATGLSNPAIANPIATPVITTEYVVTGINTFGCVEDDTVTVTVIPKPVITITPNTAICKDATIQLNASGGETFSWTPAVTLSNTSIANPVASPLGTTMYYVTATNSNLCSSLDSVLIIVDTPIVRTSNDITICSGTPVQMNTTGASTYSWSPSTGLNNPAIANPIATPVVTTQYVVTGITGNGCVEDDTVTVTVINKPILIKSPDTTICNSNSIQLVASGGETYSWTPSATLNNATIPNPIATPNVTTTYYVTATNGNFCSTIDSIKVGIRATPVFTVSPASGVCEQMTKQLMATGGDFYDWTPTTTLSDPSIANPVASPLTTTTYTVTITDTVCNISMDLSTIVTVNPPPPIVASKSNDIDCTISNATLNATGGVSYSWTPATNLNNPAIRNPVASPLNTTDFIVKGTDINGCINYDTITVNVTKDNKGSYLMASGFTPNNDGLNDCFGIKYWGIIEEVDFRVYNRWGQLIFQTNNPSGCWDGRYKGVLQSSDVFVYVITARTTCEEKVFRKGTFTLIR